MVSISISDFFQDILILFPGPQAYKTSYSLSMLATLLCHQYVDDIPLPPGVLGLG